MYRTEIDGLRAIAVILVILFHLKLRAFEGGFVGVDVFFVISGFLITGLVLRELERDAFSFTTFYVRRIMRLIPALLATLTVSLLLGILMLTPEDLVYSATQAATALVSFSNIFYWTEAGYWDPASHRKLFLHTWTLGVEEQFYLVYPFLTFAFYKLGKERAVTALLITIVVGGALLSELLLLSYPTAAFYLTPMRMYQFALGGFGSVLIRWRFFTSVVPRLGSGGSWFGLCLILVSALTFSEETEFPGFNAIPLSVGTLITILCGDTYVGKRLLANRVAVWIGQRSYSLYLVHWPIVVLYEYYSGSDFTWFEITGLVATIVLSGALLHYSVERRFRIQRDTEDARQDEITTWRVSGVAGSAFAVGLFCFLILLGDGWSWRVPAPVKALAGRRIEDSWNDVERYVGKRLGAGGGVLRGERDPTKTNILLLADSRGKDIFVALDMAYPDINTYVSMWPACPPIFGEAVAEKFRRFPVCVEFNRKRLDVALNAPQEDIIFLAMGFSKARVEPMIDMAKVFVDLGRRVFVIGQTRYLDTSALTIAIRHGRLSNIGDAIEPHLIDAPFALDSVYGPKFREIGATYIANKDFFLVDGHYRIHTEDREDLLMYDEHHLTLAGAEEYSGYLSQRFPIRTTGFEEVSPP